MPRVSVKQPTVPRLLMVAGILAATAFPQPQTVYEQAASYLQRGETASATRLLESRLKEAPQDLRALVLMGMALSADGRREQGNEYFRQALAASPTYAPALRSLAMNEMALGNQDAARKHFEELLHLTPADSVSRLGLAEIEFGARNYPA